MIEYRGYVLFSRLALLTGTDRIRRPDGSWRYSPPTAVGAHREWVIAKRSGPEILEELDTATSEEEARRKVDYLER